MRVRLRGCLHPHSGIATVTYLFEGSAGYGDPITSRAFCRGGVEWMQAGRGMCHGGGLDISKVGRAASSSGSPCRRHSNWPDHKHLSCLKMSERWPRARVLSATRVASARIVSPSPITISPCALRRAERWRYEPPCWPHRSLGTAIASGLCQCLTNYGMETCGFEQIERAVEFEALTDVEFVLVRRAHEHDLVLGYYSVHTTPDALRDGEAHIEAIKKRLVQGRPL